MKTYELKNILFKLFMTHDYYEEIINDLRNLESEKEITEEDYDIILENYDEWLEEWSKEFLENGDEFYD